MSTDRYLKTRAYSASVDDAGVIRLYDSVAGYYSTTARLTPAQERYIRARAKTEAQGGRRVITEPENARRAFGWD